LNLCDIDSDGAIALANAIKQSKSPLAVLDLSDNFLGDQGVAAIKNSIKQSKSLTTVSFGHPSF